MHFIVDIDVARRHYEIIIMVEEVIDVQRITK